MGRIMRIDLTEGTFKLEDLPGDYQGLGGRGLTSKIVSREVPPPADPLGPENKLIFSAGILAGTSAPSSGRLSVGAKSPLTNTIKEANSGGAAAQKLARLGLRAVIIEGKAKDLTSLKIDKEGVTFIPAAPLRHLGNYELIAGMREKYGDGVAVISIGPAGEKMLKAAAVAVTSPDFQIRMAARGGLGAVMGAKNLKAVIIDDEGCDRLEIKDRAGFKEAVATFTKSLLSHPITGVFKDFGTPALVMMINSLGCLPTKNYSLGQFEGAEKISGEYLAELLKKRPHAHTTHKCMDGCITQCSNILTDERGEIIVSGLEYETIGLVGSNCMINDLDVIGRINRVCNDVGVDTMDIGAALGVAMEAGMLPWGDGGAALALVREIGITERGSMIGNGCHYTGEKLGVKRIPQVKGQGMSAYDPRVLKGTGVTFATSPMGADHTAGLLLPNPAKPSYDPFAATGQALPSRTIQGHMAAVDSLGLCMMVGLPLWEMGLEKQIAACVAALTGQTLPDDYLVKLGWSVLQAEREFNRAAGFTAQDDRLPAFFRQEKLPPGGNIFDVADEEIDKTFYIED